LNVAVEGDSMTLTLNGRAVHRRVLEPSNNRQFGFYHDKDRTSVRVRNVVLKGCWPESLNDDERRNLAVLPASELGTDADRRFRHAVIGESSIGGDVDDVLRRAGDLAPEQRYDYLASWVLPSPDHPVFRLQGDFSPSNPASVKDGGTPMAPRTLVGGE